MTPISLTESPTQQELIISHIVGNTDISQRLAMLGFCPGNHIQLFTKKTFGGHYVCQVLGTKIAIRSQDAKRIFVTPDL